MSILTADRVYETTAVVGVGTMTLLGAETGYQAFDDAFDDQDEVYYCVTDDTDWEVGVGTFTSAGTLLSRDTILASSNSGSAVNWGSGTKDVFSTASAEILNDAATLEELHIMAALSM